MSCLTMLDILRCSHVVDTKILHYLLMRALLAVLAFRATGHRRLDKINPDQYYRGR